MTVLVITPIEGRPDELDDPPLPAQTAKLNRFPVTAAAPEPSAAVFGSISLRVSPRLKHAGLNPREAPRRTPAFLVNHAADGRTNAAARGRLSV